MHTYFAINDISQTKVEGLAGTEYIDKVGGSTNSYLQENDVFFNQEVDRIYTDPPSELRLKDGSTNNRVTIKSKGSKTAIVWNPWTKISKNSDDLTDDAYQQFVCIETANAVEDKVIIQPNGSHTLEAEFVITEE